MRHPLFKSSRFLGAMSAVLPGGSLLAWSHFVETRRLEVTRHRVRLEGMTGTLRMLHISDLHFTHEDRWARQMIARLHDIPCDVAVCTGDLTLPGFEPDVVRSMLRALPHPPLGLFLSPGNWEYWTGFRGEMLELLARDTGMTLLLHDAVTLPGGVTLAGVDSELAGRPEVERTFSRMPPGQPAIVLSHCPSLYPQLDRDPVRLVLSGHTHGGQVRLPLMGATWLPVGSGPYDQGWFDGARSRLYVNRGFGTSMARLRFMCRPEATLLELHG